MYVWRGKGDEDDDGKEVSVWWRRSGRAATRPEKMKS